MIPLLANSLWCASCLPHALAFRSATRRVAETQRRLLSRIVRHNRNSAFGRQYDFASIRSVADFQQRVPLSTGTIPPSEPVLRHVPTSGTTAPTKLIPYTPSLKTEFQHGIAPWIVDLFFHEPQLLLGKAYWSISPVSHYAEGFADDSEYLGVFTQRLARSIQAVPPSVRYIRNIDAWRFETLVHLLRCRELALISVWNPTFLTLLVEPLQDWWPRLAKRLGDVELSQIFSEESDTAAIHKRLWPKLRVISCWMDAAAARPAADLARLFPQARLQPKGLIATEGFVSLPLQGCDGAVLAVRSHFFEFLDATGTARLAHEVQVDKQYSVVLTTSGGLYRYQLHDRVQVVGFERQSPLLRFIGKEAYVSDRFGEKLSEQQVTAALEPLLARHGVAPAFVSVACEDNAYTLFVETRNATDERLAMLGTDLEASLRENFHYRYCRDLGQLRALQVFRIAHGGRAAGMAECCRRGQRLGEVKPLVLQRDGGWMKVFEGRLVSDWHSVRLQSQ